MMRKLVPQFVAVFLIGLGLFIYFLDSDLINFFLPIRWLVLVLLVLGTMVSVVALLVTKPPVVYKVLASALTLGVLSVGVYIYIEEFAAYREIEINFTNQQTKLSGTLYLPLQKGNYQAVVIAQGSIKAPRRLYHFWADMLVRQGIAVFSFDKRGTGQSDGIYQSDNNASIENLNLLASDVSAAVSVVSQHQEINSEQLGVLGISMGGWTAPIAAISNPEINYIVLISGPVVSVGEEMYYSKLTGGIHGDDSGLTQSEIETLTMQRNPSGYDPRDTLSKLNIPGLWLFAEDDSSIPVNKSLVTLNRIIDSSGQAYRYITYPNAEHLGFQMTWPYDLAPGFERDLVSGIKTIQQN